MKKSKRAKIHQPLHVWYMSLEAWLSSAQLTIYWTDTNPVCRSIRTSLQKSVFTIDKAVNLCKCQSVQVGTRIFKKAPELQASEQESVVWRAIVPKPAVETVDLPQQRDVSQNGKFYLSSYQGHKEFLNYLHCKHTKKHLFLTIVNYFCPQWPQLTSTRRTTQTCLTSWPLCASGIRFSSVSMLKAMSGPSSEAGAPDFLAFLHKSPREYKHL